MAETSSIQAPALEDVKLAAARVSSRVHQTPVMTCEGLDRIAGAELFFKCENLQKVGAFKARGATNAVFSLSEEAAQRGVATHSSGNHAAALAWAARERGIVAHVVMPTSSPRIKRIAVEGYGAEITDCEPTLMAREAALEEVVARTGATFIHPYDNPEVVAGQGTAALELHAEIDRLQIVVTPLGGGGLLSGTAIATAGLAGHVEVIGAEPEIADDAYRSLRAGVLLPSDDSMTVADGLRTALSPMTFGVLRRFGVRVLTASEEGIIEAMRMIWERAKIVVEPSAAVTLAIVLANPAEFQGRRIGLILSGGNVDFDHLPW
ncbi:MAG: pyridoxal-phosphate dependent enzyme [bacterium]|nr:pyridoxal-phosphate dependent enzyme [bacterium]